MQQALTDSYYSEIYFKSHKSNNKQVGGNIRARTRRHLQRQPFT